MSYLALSEVSNLPFCIAHLMLVLDWACYLQDLQAALDNGDVAFEERDLLPRDHIQPLWGGVALGNSWTTRRGGAGGRDWEQLQATGARHEAAAAAAA